MDTDDLEPVKKKKPLKDLDVMSIEALGEYIEEMETEIARVREKIAFKEKARQGAESFFKSRG
ncbi:MAG: DUF1192 domain-containing protein [Rhodospirillales bacterium]|nr:DUF1192 domain-containing protein [Rhodospirillales bacterium]